MVIVGVLCPEYSHTIILYNRFECDVYSSMFRIAIVDQRVTYFLFLVFSFSY